MLAGAAPGGPRGVGAYFDGVWGQVVAVHRTVAQRSPRVLSTLSALPLPYRVTLTHEISVARRSDSMYNRSESNRIGSECL
ncbi:hypothetical protein Acsp04_60530 [Actinomadura sp. NBRC 104425]|nr:hypothetical protein Acsp04_60530 [Actinomadura sp. NBRC 104425]